jgi:hypothetical protein
MGLDRRASARKLLILGRLLAYRSTRWTKRWGPPPCSARSARTRKAGCINCYPPAYNEHSFGNMDQSGFACRDTYLINMITVAKDFPISEYVNIPRKVIIKTSWSPTSNTCSRPAEASQAHVLHKKPLPFLAACAYPVVQTNTYRAIQEHLPFLSHY